MATQSHSRKALNSLPINVHGSPRNPSSTMTTNTTLKRQIEDVDSSQSPPSSVRFRLTKNSTIERKSKRESSRMAAATTQAPRSRDFDLLSANTNPDPEEGDSQDSCKDSVTSLVEFDPMDDTMASQQTAATETSNSDQSAISLRAELLRLRLRVAMFKVRTNQTNLPMSQLHISPKSPPARHPTLSTSPEQNASVPKLLPAPELKPTAYSARTIQQTHVPSSPPNSCKNSPEGDVEKEVFRTPALPKGKTRVVDLQLSSPPDSQERDVKMVDEADSLTSSAVRGSAARSLLGLAQTNR